MKNQYFGDINDFRKLGLLRALTDKGKISAGVCWMMTPEDGSQDGKFVDYLWNPVRWRNYDPELFDELREAVAVNGVRRVSVVEESNLLPQSRFFCEMLSDNLEARKLYFESFRSIASECDLIFFDPDNGMEVKTKPKGCKDSSKYLYWSELVDAFLTGKPVLVYQHFPRLKRDVFISEMARELADRTGATAVYSFRTASVVFFLILPETRPSIDEQFISSVIRIWHGQIGVQEHLFADRVRRPV